jgi:hypothetical protein
MNLERILRKPQGELKHTLNAALQRMGYSPVSRKGFLYAEGTVPVMLVAHLDTVHKNRVQTICYSKDGNILMSPQGIGGDDRAGVYIVLELLAHHKCHVLFCEDEEYGAIGAHAFAHSCILPDVNYIVEVDRRGEKDAVFYDCYNPEFTDFVCNFGFVENFGSFSDISVIAPVLGVAAVNISAGYSNEHTLHEHINVAYMRNNIVRLCGMIGTATERFKYVDAYLSTQVSGLPEDAYLLDPFGEMCELSDELLIDEDGAIYEYLDDYDAAVRIHGYTVKTSSGLPARFNKHRARPIDILPIEDLM